MRVLSLMNESEHEEENLGDSKEDATNTSGLQGKRAERRKVRFLSAEGAESAENAET
jgi:hypothetical protein